MKRYDVAHLDALERVRVGEEGLTWRPVRRRLGIGAFGVNAYTAEQAGQATRSCSVRSIWTDGCAPGPGDDEDFSGLRDDPRFVSAIAGEPDADGPSS